MSFSMIKTYWTKNPNAASHQMLYFIANLFKISQFLKSPYVIVSDLFCAAKYKVLV